MTSPIAFRRLLACGALILVVASAGCGSPDAAAGSDGAGLGDGPAQGDAGADPTDLPSTASLFLTIDNMEVRSDLPGLPPGSGGFWWPLGGLGNWFFDSAGANGEPGTHGDAVADSIVPPRGDSMRARHLQISGATAGADLSAQLRHPTNRPVDLTPYLGISFWAKLGGPGRRLIVALRDAHSAAILSAQSADSQFAQAISVSEGWERHVLLFDDFRQGVMSGSASDTPFTANAVSTMDFVVGLDGDPFDLWIDDLALLCRGICQVRSF